MMAGRGEDGGKALSVQRAKLAAAQAAKAEFQNALAAGEYCSTILMQRFLMRMFAIMREIALSTPGKVADSLTPFTPKDRAEIHEIVKREIYEMLNTLSDPSTITDDICDEESKK
jgi:phage terminase Nu1 subunit (DNA packaging protein)